MKLVLRVGVAALVLAAVAPVAACSDGQKSALGAAAERAGATASRLDGPAGAASDSLANSLVTARSSFPGAARAIADNARCVSDATVGVLGEGLVARYRAAGADLGALSGLTGEKVDRLEAALGGCVDVREVLVSALTRAGLPADKAACVADRGLQDDDVLGSILLNMVFGDPGFTTVVAVAARAGSPCLSASDLARLVPTR